MVNRKPLTNKGGEVREITKTDVKTAIGFFQLPDSLRQKIARRGKQKTPIKTPISIRLSPEVIAFYRAQGRGWQNRMDADLQWLTTRPQSHPF